MSSEGKFDPVDVTITVGRHLKLKRESEGQDLVYASEALRIHRSFLQAIEEGEIDQHEGSYEVGKLLKELYIDSALRRETKRDKKRKKKC